MTAYVVNAHPVLSSFIRRNVSKVASYIDPVKIISHWFVPADFTQYVVEPQTYTCPKDVNALTNLFTIMIYFNSIWLKPVILPRPFFNSSNYFQYLVKVDVTVEKSKLTDAHYLFDFHFREFSETKRKLTERQTGLAHMVQHREDRVVKK